MVLNRIGDKHEVSNLFLLAYINDYLNKIKNSNTRINSCRGHRMSKPLAVTSPENLGILVAIDDKKL